MQFVLNAIERCGGVASTAQLRANGVERSLLDLLVGYGRIVRVRKGLWAAPDLPPAVRRAHSAGGRLACVSALRFHGLIEEVGGQLHIAASSGVTKWRPPRDPGVVRHWSRRPLPGDRFAVSAEAAWEQFALCRAVASGDVRLQRTDSL